MNKPQPSDERIQRALDGLLSAEAQRAFQADVVRDPKLRADYVEQMWLHSTLRAEGETLGALFQEASPSVENSVRRWPLAILSAGLAAILTLSVSAGFFGKTPLFRGTVATLVQADNCKWAGSDLPTALNSKLGTGRLALVEGIATLKFKSGATLTIEAPSTLEILTPMHCRLLEGTLTAEVPQPAHGFTVDTPDLKVVDLGTKFGVSSGSTGNSQVHVFEGEIEIPSADGKKGQRITKGHGLRVGSGRTPIGQEPTRNQEALEAGGWTLIPTSFGRGKDSYVQRGDTEKLMGSNPLILVKHTDLTPGSKNERRGVMTFDLSKIPPLEITEAQLVLDPKPSGVGFASLVPDSRFAVYGLTDERLDAWDESQVRWESLPGCTDDGPNPNATRKLAEFWIPRGGTGGPITIRSDALAEFIRTKTNGLASFLIVRETGETDPSGIAHAFASKEHPTGRPPTLRLKCPLLSP